MNRITNKVFDIGNEYTQTSVAQPIQPMFTLSVWVWTLPFIFHRLLTPFVSTLVFLLTTCVVQKGDKCVDSTQTLAYRLMNTDQNDKHGTYFLPLSISSNMLIVTICIGKVVICYQPIALKRYTKYQIRFIDSVWDLFNRSPTSRELFWCRKRMYFNSKAFYKSASI